jgi:mRNA interferase RelE/StbE
MEINIPIAKTKYSSTIGSEIVIYGGLHMQWAVLLRENLLACNYTIESNQPKNRRLLKSENTAYYDFSRASLPSRASLRSYPSDTPACASASTKRPPPWFVGFTSQFKKDISKIDRKLMGRVLEMLSKITEEPCLPNGDTIKPLGGEKKGFWRARIGDYRLVYFPDLEMGNISIHTLASRGSVYE